MEREGIALAVLVALLWGTADLLGARAAGGTPRLDLRRHLAADRLRNRLAVDQLGTHRTNSYMMYMVRSSSDRESITDAVSGPAVLVRTRDPDAARGILTADRYAGIEVHSWQPGGRPS